MKNPDGLSRALQGQNVAKRSSSTPVVKPFMRFVVTVHEAKVLPAALWSSTDRRLMAQSSAPLTLEQVASVQTELGYHPAGYGPPARVGATQDTAGHWITTWSCARSCD